MDVRGEREKHNTTQIWFMIDFPHSIIWIDDWVKRMIFNKSEYSYMQNVSHSTLHLKKQQKQAKL